MPKGTYLFTSESVSEGHPDKVSDRISDAVVDLYLGADPLSRVACETLTTTNRIVLAGEVRGPESITKEMIENVSSMGFDRDVANEALKHCKGDLQKTLDLLTNNPEKISDIMEKSGEEFQKTEDARKRMEEDIGEGNGFLL